MSLYNGWGDAREEEREGDAPGDWCGEQQADGWRGDVHLPDWPEEMAGPIYWLLKREADTEGEV